jgi:hypothetical protein
VVRFGRTDGNQQPIVSMLNQIPGVSVKVLSDVGDGFTDVIIGRLNVNYLIEIKNGSCLTPAQEDFHGVSENKGKEWKGQKAVCNSLEEVFEVIGITQGA